MEDAKALPAAPTPDERPGGKADWFGLFGDPREGDPDFEYTEAPGDEPLLPGEYEPIRTLLVTFSWSYRDYYTELLRAAAQTIEPIVFVDSLFAREAINAYLWGAGIDTNRIYYMNMNTNSVWMRDYGPLAVRTRHGHHFIDPRYYDNRVEDDRIPTALGHEWNIPVSRPPLRMEGGNVQADGKGRCITTEWLVGENASFGYSYDDVTQILKGYLGCTSVTYVPYIAGERTGHVDMLATITGPGAVLVGAYDPWEDATNAARLDEAATRLSNAGFTVTRIPMPGHGDGTYRTYTNSIVLNDQVLVPVYPDDVTHEREALETYQAAYPDKWITPIDASSIIAGAGAIHCTTMTIAN